MNVMMEPPTVGSSGSTPGMTDRKVEFLLSNDGEPKREEIDDGGFISPSSGQSRLLRRRQTAAHDSHDGEDGAAPSTDAAAWESVSHDEAQEVDSQPLTLMEQLILLGLRDKQVQICCISHHARACSTL